MPEQRPRQRRHVRDAASEPALIEISGCENGGVYGATIVNLSRSGMRLSVPQPLEQGTPVNIQWSEPRIDSAGIVRYCRQNSRDDAYYIGVELAVPLERRKEPRFPVRERALITFLNVGEASTRGPGLVLDLSKSGFSVQVEEWVPVGQQVVVSLKSQTLFGTVRNIREGDGCYVIGVQRSEVAGNGIPAAFLVQTGSGRRVSR